MYSEYFDKFCKDRNVKDSTKKGYMSALRHYLLFHEESLEYLINEAIEDENNKVSLKDRKLKHRLLNFRNYLISSSKSTNTIKTYFTRVKTIYIHFDIEIPHLPDVQYETTYITNYYDLPTKEHIAKALEIVSIDLKAIILFMYSSGTAKAETLSITVEQFFQATSLYHNGGSIDEILDTLEKRNDVVPTFYLRRIKTDKYYYTYCSSEASKYIVKYLKTRNNLKLSDYLFDFTSSSLISKFQEINDKMDWGFKGNYRLFRSHNLRKFHASNIGLSSEYIDA